MVGVALVDSVAVAASQPLLEAIGLEPEAFRAALQEEGATIASVIEANGGDVRLYHCSTRHGL